MSHRHRLLLRILAMMPQYRDAKKLAAWEYAVKGLLEETDYNSELGSLITSIFEFGLCNLYSEFNAADAMDEYQTCSRKLEMHQIPVPPVSKLVKY